MKQGKGVQPSNVKPRWPRAVAVIAAALGLAVAVSEPAEAIDLEFGKVSGSFDATVSIGTSIRVQDRDSRRPGCLRAGHPVFPGPAMARSGLLAAKSWIPVKWGQPCR